jgi:hypothetical protein
MNIQSKKLLMLLLVTISSCTGVIESREDVTKKLVLDTYKKAWIDGANAAADAVNSGKSWDEEVARQQLKKDSLAFVGLIYGNK